MKNKNGWGLNEMIIFCAIIVGFLILVVILVNNLYKGLQNDTSVPTKKSYTYSEVENNLKNAAKKYHNLYEDIELIEANDLLIENLINDDKLTPLGEKSPCDGYVIVETANVLKSYISCEKYETKGY